MSIINLGVAIVWENIPLAFMPASIYASGTLPTYRIINGDLFIIWILVDTSSNYTGMYILRCKSDKTYCSYITGSGNPDGFFTLTSDKNNFYIAAGKNIGIVPIPISFVSSFKFNLLQSIFQINDAGASSHTVNFSVSFGPFLDGNNYSYITLYLDPTDGNASVYDGVRYSKNGSSNFFTYSGNLTGSSISDPSFINTRFGNQYSIYDNFNNPISINNSSGKYNNVKLHFSSETFLNAGIIFDHLNPNNHGTSILSSNEPALFDIPYAYNFYPGITDDNLFAIFTDQFTSNYIYCISPILNISQTYQLTNFYDDIALWNGNVFSVGLIGGAGISVEIVVNSNPLNLLKYQTNRNLNNLNFYSAGFADFQTQLSNSQKYLINMHRAVSPIGGYKS